MLRVVVMVSGGGPPSGDHRSCGDGTITNAEIVGVISNNAMLCAGTCKRTRDFGVLYLAEGV